MYHQDRTVVKCALGTTEPIVIEVGLHQESAPCPCVIGMKPA